MIATCRYESDACAVGFSFPFKFLVVQLSFILIDNDLQFNETMFSFVVDGTSRRFAPFLSTTQVK